MGCSNCISQPQANANLPGASIYIKNARGSFIPAEFYNLCKQYTLVISPSACDKVSEKSNWLQLLMVKSPANILVYSGSEDSESSEYLDAEAVFWFLSDCLKVHPSQMILLGREKGCEASCYLIEKYSDIGGLILQHPENSTLTFTVKNLKSPLLIIHEPKTPDQQEFGRKIYNNCSHHLKNLKIVSIEKYDEVVEQISGFLTQLA